MLGLVKCIACTPPAGVILLTASLALCCCRCHRQDLYLLAVTELSRIGMHALALPFMDRLRGELAGLQLECTQHCAACRIL
jgi:hypothetical protein